MSTVTILTSGVGLGVYIPAVLIEQRLRSLGIAAQVEVLEKYFRPERQQGHLAHQRAHHQSFALAQMAHRMARDVSDSLAAESVEALLETWRRERRTRFVVWSGFWIPVLERYTQRLGTRLEVDFCRIDAEVSASFKIHAASTLPHQEIWLWDWAQRATVNEIPVTSEAPIPFAQREHRLVVHGGGWGIGTYQARADSLRSTRFALDRIVHDVSELHSADRCFSLAEGWHPWHLDEAGVAPHPPMGVLDASGFHPLANDGCHAMHRVIQRAKAIVSKPGGCTLIDSLSSATPVVLLEPYGYAEESNGKIWEHLGYGISWEAWAATGFDEAVLGRLHLNLLHRAQRGPDYPLRLAQEAQGREVA